MQIIVHMPQTDEEIKVFQNKLATAHATIIRYYIANLPYKEKEKIVLYEAVKNKIREGAQT